MNVACGREGLCCFEEIDLVFPGSGIALDEFHSERGQ